MEKTVHEIGRRLSVLQKYAYKSADAEDLAKLKEGVEELITYSQRARRYIQQLKAMHERFVSEIDGMEMPPDEPE